MTDLESVVSTVKKQNDWRKRECINLIASENVMSPLAEKAYSSDFMHRYAEGLPGKRYYQGTKYFDELEQESFELMRDLFKSEYADTRPVSGTNANMALYTALTKPGDRFMSPGVPAGGHISSEKFGSAGVRGLEIDHFEYDFDAMEIDVPASLEKIKTFNPRLICLGASMFTQPHPVSEVSKLARDMGITLWYDAAHVAGLIAGGQFQEPLAEGAVIMTMSTHKTLPGPQGGAIISNQGEDEWKSLQRAVFPGVVSNHHLHKTPSLLITLLEFKEFGEAYAAQTVKNAQTLAKELDAFGFKVLWKDKGFTQSHQVVLDVQDFGGGKKLSQDLEEANIITNMNLLPYDDVKKATNPSGLRLGVQEMTFLGMKEDEMKRVADWIYRIASGETKTTVKSEAGELKEQFTEPVYCTPSDKCKDLLSQLTL